MKESTEKELELERTAFQRAMNELRRQTEAAAKMKDALYKASERTQLGDIDPTDDVRVISLLDTEELNELLEALLEENAHYASELAYVSSQHHAVSCLFNFNQRLSLISRVETILPPRTQRVDLLICIVTSDQLVYSVSFYAFS